MSNSTLFQRLLATAVAALGLGLLQCSGGGTGENMVGTPCTPSLEKDARFASFKVTEETIETGAPECGGGVCLVNHFQGRMSCPLGQAAPVDAQGLEGCTPVFENGLYVVGQGSCEAGYNCVQAASLSPSCDPGKGFDADKQCQNLGAGGRCSSEGFCECETDSDCLFVKDAVVSCDKETKQCMTYACHKPNDCQQVGAAPGANAGKACCLPGSDIPVLEPVCGQCQGQGDSTTRDADNAVYCTCRCGVAEGAPEEPDFDFCSCPDGFECSEIRKNFGLGDQTVTGKYCIRRDTAYDPNQDQCGQVDGFWSSGGAGEKCAGVGTGKCQTSDGPCD
jgi:hypothetical protein